MKNQIPIKMTLKDINEALHTNNTNIILAVIREYATFKKKGPVNLKDDFHLIDFSLALKKLGLVLTVVPNERAKKIWK